MKTIKKVLTEYKSNIISLDDAENEIINIIKSYNKDFSDTYDAELQKIENRCAEKISNLKAQWRQRQIDECEHSFGGVDWHDACNGTQICRKCGYRLRVYERD